VKQDKFLIAILVGVGLLVVVAVGLFLVRQKQVDYVAEDTPQGIVSNYILALHRGDYQKAYGYIYEAEYKPSLEKFQQVFITKQNNLSSVSPQVGESNIQEKQAYVTIRTVQTEGGPFIQSDRYPQNAVLINQNGIWKISNMPYPYWNWEWYQTPPKSAP
jgi:hypothetical protein